MGIESIFNWKERGLLKFRAGSGIASLVTGEPVYFFCTDRNCFFTKATEGDLYGYMNRSFKVIGGSWQEIEVD